MSGDKQLVGPLPSLVGPVPALVGPLPEPTSVGRTLVATSFLVFFMWCFIQDLLLGMSKKLASLCFKSFVKAHERRNRCNFIANIYRLYQLQAICEHNLT
jgi:hypothetical protein